MGPERDRSLFCEVLQQFIGQSGRTVGQLARLTHIPKATLANWQQGRVRRPRNVEDLLKLAAALSLAERQASLLLQAADYPSIARLRSGLLGPDRAGLLAPWSDGAPNGADAPFQAIADLPYFAGREQHLLALEQWLLSPEHAAPYILHGMAGVGKTVLAARLAYRLRSHFRDGVLWASLSSSDPMSILLNFGRAYNHDVGEFGDLASRSAMLRTLLADKRALIVLDDASNSEDVRPLLPPSGPAAVLVTTRRADLGISLGGQRFLIGPFDVEGREALTLFARMLGELRVQEEEAQFTEMADLLGHLPLATAIAACRLVDRGNWTTATFLERLRDEHVRLDELVSEDLSVRLSFNLSFEASCPPQRRLFSALGALDGDDFSIQAAAYVSELPVDAAADLLRELYSLSLVQEGRPGRYRLHLLLRDYARATIQDPETYRRAVDYYVDFAQRHAGDYDALDLELGNLLGALELAHEQRLLRALLGGTLALFPFLSTRGAYTSAHLHLSRAIDAARALEDRSRLASVLCYQGRIQRIRGEYEKASACLQESLALAGELDDKQCLSAIISELVMVEQMRANRERADAYFRHALAMIGVDDGAERTVTLLLALGLFKLMHGDCRGAESYLRSGLSIARAANDPLEISSLVLGLGMVAYRQGNYERAEGCLAQALSLARDIGYRSVESTALMGLAVVAGRQGSYEQATTYLEEGLALSHQGGQSWATARLLNEWGDVCLALGKTTVAAMAFEQSLEIAQETGAQALVGEALFGLAQIAADCEDIAGAMRTGGESSAILRHVQHYRAAEVENWLIALVGGRDASA